MLCLLSIAVAAPPSVGDPMPAWSAQDDWPFGVEASCVELDEVVVCGDAAVEVVHQRIPGPVEGPVEWRRTAGMEWTSGQRREVADDHVLWASASGGWDSRGAVAAHIVREDPGHLAGRLAQCDARLEAFPVVVMYDASGVARRVRFQGFPPDDAGDLGCVAWAVGVLPFTGVTDVELEVSVSASPPPPDAASPGTSRTPPAP